MFQTTDKFLTYNGVNVWLMSEIPWIRGEKHANKFYNYIDDKNLYFMYINIFLNKTQWKTYCHRVDV